MKNEALKLIESKIEKLVSADSMKKYDTKRPFNKLPNVPFQSYDEMKKAIDNKKVSIVINFVNSSGTAFDLIAKKSEKIIFWFSLSTTYVITILMIGLAIFLSNYFLLITILWLIIASKFSSYYTNPPLYPFKGRRVADLALIVGILTLFLFDGYTIPLLALSYVLIHWSYALHRKIYGTVLHSRAMQSELLFKFLYIGRYIHLSQAEGKSSIFQVRN